MLPSYVELSDPESGAGPLDNDVRRRSASPPVQLSLFADDEPQRRLSRALSSLSISSGSELPSTARILSDLRAADRDRDRDRGGSSSDLDMEAGDVIEVSD